MYHVRISTRSDISNDETKIDLDESELRAQFIEPYEEGRPIAVNGRIVPLDDLARMRITQSDTSSAQIRQLLRQEDSRSTVFVIGGPSDEWRIAAHGRDVSDEFIKGAPGSRKARAESIRRLNRNIFIAHSGESPALYRLIRFLRALGMEAQVAEWLPSSGTQIPDHVRRVFGDCECAIIFAEATRPEGKIARPGAGVLIEVGLLQSHFEERIIYLREESASFGAMADSYVAASFTQNNLEEAFYKIVVELKAWGFL